MTLGKRLTNERERRGWSQKFAADQIGVSNTVLSNYERDFREPNLEVLCSISRVYDISIDYLATGTVSKELSAFESKIVEEIRKYPDELKKMSLDTEKEISDFIKWQKFKKSIIE